MKTTCTFLVFLSLFSICFAQLNPTTISIPMRDGKNLSADIYLPDTTKTYPTILIQTPYNKGLIRLAGLPLGIGRDISMSNYAVVIVDWRCYFQSAAACGLNTPSRGEDGYDVVEWIAQQSWSDGQVGTWGPSALGSIQFQTAREQPPHLVCSVPIVVSPHVYFNKYFPGGTARVDYTDFVGTYFGLKNLLAANPYYNLLWTITENGSMYPSDIEVPMMIVGGWFDHNTDDCITMFDTLVQASDPAVQDQHRLLMGPWTHSLVGRTNQGELSFPEAESWDDSLALLFFDHHLRGIQNNWDLSPKIQFFQLGEKSWQHSENWPPPGNGMLGLHLYADQSLFPQVPGYIADSLFLTYDPQDPSPSIGGKTFSTDILQRNVGPKDQRNEVESRDDHIIFNSAPLIAPVNVQGKIKANLHVSSNRLDTDIALRITDVYPDGRSILIGESILRMHFRNGYRARDTAYMEPGKVYEVELLFEHLAHTFQPDHQIRLIITSSNYPRFNRNMNTGGPMYPNGNLDTLVNPLIATNYIYMGQLYASHITLPLGKNAVGLNFSQHPSPIQVFPNPSSGQFLLSEIPDWKSISVYDLNGREIWKNDKGGPAGRFELSLETYPPGVYFLRLMSEKGKVFSSRLLLR